MPKSSRDSMCCVEKNEFGPDLFGYWKHLFLELFSPNGDALLPMEEFDPKSSAGMQSTNVLFDGQKRETKVNSFKHSVSFFGEPISKGLSEPKKERLNLILNQSITCLNEESDEFLDQILASFQIEADLRERELLGFYSSASDDDLSGSHISKKQKASSSPSPNYFSHLASQTVEQVYNAVRALQGNSEIDHESVEKYLNKIFVKLGKMEEDLEEFLNVVVSKCRPMTRAEQQQLGRLIQKLPGKAIDRVVEIIKGQKSSTSNLSEPIHVNLEEQDNVKLWRLYYYAEKVAKANKL